MNGNRRKQAISVITPERSKQGKSVYQPKDALAPGQKYAKMRLTGHHRLALAWGSQDILCLDEVNQLPCSVCGRLVPDASVACGDILYSPSFGDGDDRQAAEIERRWGVDAYEDFAICEPCCGGYCGAIPWRDADAWLAEKRKEGE